MNTALAGLKKGHTQKRKQTNQNREKKTANTKNKDASYESNRRRVLTLARQGFCEKKDKKSFKLKKKQTLGCKGHSFISSFASGMKMGTISPCWRAVYLGATGSMT